MSAIAEPTQRAEPERRVLVIFAGLMLVMLLAALDQTIVSTALPTIVGDLGGLAHLSSAGGDDTGDSRSRSQRSPELDRSRRPNPHRRRRSGR